MTGDAPRLALTATAVHPLSEDRCWELLAESRIGRLALVRSDGGPDLFPMDYLVHDRRIFLRTAPGTKLFSLAHEHRVAFEVEGRDAGMLCSVVVHGTADRLDADDEIEESGVLDLVSTSPTGKHNYIRITPAEVTGRAFHPRA